MIGGMKHSATHNPLSQTPAQTPETTQAAATEEPVATVLNDLQIWDFIREMRFVRLATIGEDGFPYVSPINVVSDGQHIYFRTAAGAKLTQLLLNPQVTVQAERIEMGRATTINAFCQAAMVTDSQEIEHILSLKLAPWLDTEKLEFVRMTPVKLTGRRFRIGK